MRPPTDDGGAIAVVVAAFAVVVFGLAALVVDLSLAREGRAAAQNAADAGALAAAAELDLEAPDYAAAAGAAKSTVSVAYGTVSWSDCSLGGDEPEPTGGGWEQQGSGTPCIQFRGDADTAEAFVRVPAEPVPVLFGGIAGYEGMTVAASAQAEVTEEILAAESECVLCFSGSLSLTSSVVTVTDPADVLATQIELEGASALRHEGGGATRYVDSATGSEYDPPAEQEPPGRDVLLPPPPDAPERPTLPLAPPPDCATGPIAAESSYSGLTISGACTVAPGQITVSGNLSIEATGALTGDDVTLYVDGDVIVAPGGSIDLGSPSTDGHSLVVAGAVDASGDVTVRGSVHAGELEVTGADVVVVGDVAVGDDTVGGVTVGGGGGLAVTGFLRATAVDLTAGSHVVDGALLVADLSITDGELRLAGQGSGEPLPAITELVRALSR